MRLTYFLILIILTPFGVMAQTDTIETALNTAVVRTRRLGTVKSREPQNGFTINQTELLRAACCNLGESFTTNPSVDVSYSDAATGARQIRLLGLSGQYVQMLSENVPSLRGAAQAYGLGYVPGPWMKSIQVSKGAASVKNGYESITGQINVEYLKPQDENNIHANLYGNTMGKLEANADANVHMGKRWSAGVLAHFENGWGHHDKNKDGFEDDPMVRQYNMALRTAYFSDNYIFQAFVRGLSENRKSGQLHNMASMSSPYRILLETEHYDAFAKQAFILNKDHGTNLALILSGSWHDADARYGQKSYDVTQENGYASLLFETNFTPQHSLSAGWNLNYDHFKQKANLLTTEAPADFNSETTNGLYAQYTYNLDDKLVLMGGFRVDHSNVFGTFVTPRAHIRYLPAKWVTLRLSAGKGYRTVHALAENHYLVASGRKLLIQNNLPQEAAWNYGFSSQFAIPIHGKKLDIGLEYYFTDFQRQVLIDYDLSPEEIHIGAKNGSSFSHTIQIEASYPVIRGLNLTAAWRWQDAKAHYGHIFRTRPLNNRYKALLSASYKTPLELWQFDATFQLNGPGRIPTTLSQTPTHYKAYGQLSAQITRWFRHFSIYAGGENLTNFKQKNPIIGANDPWSNSFDPTLVWGPTTGAMGYIGIRYEFN
ncbi:MAG: TonB-dependent receptor [Alloprevotella sp.]|nr:TonB-dependent receptor [Alloprevotella sp.]